ncbi:MAG: endonuclease/exonuclease/phosphatase family protein [Clostridia bacterium]|nr:endonuclease/exonuclease/phosphatase family protein [Clostridia bacterium]
MENKIKVMSFNISCGEPSEERHNRIIERIKGEAPDVIGLQEGIDLSCERITKALGDTYTMLGHGREENSDGENTNIMFRKDKFELLESKTFWITDTPEVFSKHPESCCPRIYTYQLLKTKENGQIFLHVNTHFDHIGVNARIAQAKILTSWIEKTFGDKYPVFITGDFNCTSDSEEYNVIINAGYTVTNVTGENTYTFNGYGESEIIIDFCFINDKIKPVSYHVCDGKINGEWVSDHNAIVSEISIIC